MAVEEMTKRARAQEKKSGKIATGNQVLDDALYGGFMAGSTVMIIGDKYSGRDILARQIASRSILTGVPMKYVSTNMNLAAATKELNRILKRAPDREIPDIYDAYTLEERGEDPNIYSHLMKWLPLQEGKSPRIIIDTHKYPLKDEMKEVNALHTESLPRVRDGVSESDGLLVLVVSDTNPEIGALRELADYELTMSSVGAKGEINLKSRFPVDIKGLEFAKEEDRLLVRPKGDRVAASRR